MRRGKLRGYIVCKVLSSDSSPTDEIFVFPANPGCEVGDTFVFLSVVYQIIEVRYERGADMG